MKRFFSLPVIIILSLLPMLPMALHADTLHTSDGAMHLARIASYYREVTAGQFPVRWASTLNYGYGTPIFNFFHPLPYLITSLFVALGSSLAWALKLSFIASYVLSGVFAYLMAKKLFRDNDIAFLAAVLYQFAPFRLVDILQRGSLGGVYSYTLLPLVIYGIALFLENRRISSLILIAASSSLLAISHNIIGFTFFGVALVIGLMLAKTGKDRILVTAAMLWGVVLSMWFVFPAITEHDYTLGYLYTKDLYLKHFPKLYTLFIPNFTNDAALRVAEVSVQIGLVHVIGMTAAVWMLIRRRMPARHIPLMITLLVGSGITVFFMQPVSSVFWRTVPLIAQFQFPWRLLSVICFSGALLTVSLAYLFPAGRKRTVAVLAIAAVSILTTVWYWNPPEGYDKVDEKYWWNYPLTSNYYGEVDTIWAEGPAKGYPPAPAVPVEGTAAIGPVTHHGVVYTYDVTASTDATILQHTAYFPGWTVAVDGRKTPIEFQNQLYRGLITYKVPSGTHSVRVAFTQSGRQRLGNAVSLAALLVTGLAGIILWKRHA